MPNGPLTDKFLILEDFDEGATLAWIEKVCSRKGVHIEDVTDWVHWLESVAEAAKEIRQVMDNEIPPMPERTIGKPDGFEWP